MPDGVLFPAHAGVILAIVRVIVIAGPFPRIRGGDPFQNWAATAGDNFSPYMRG